MPQSPRTSGQNCSTKVERGETIIIARSGKPIARLVPEAIAREHEIAQAMAQIQEMRKHGPRATVEEILTWRDEGRK